MGMFLISLKCREWHMEARRFCVCLRHCKGMTLMAGPEGIAQSKGSAIN